MAENNIEIEVSDFGPISTARIELRPLTVFLGPGNTGKTFMTALTCALARHYGNGLAFPGTVPFVAGHMRERRTGNGSNTAETDRQLDTFITGLLNTLSGSAKGDFTLEEETASLIPGLLEGLGGKFLDEAKRCFGHGSAEPLISKWSDGRSARIRVKGGSPKNKERFLQEFRIKASNGGATAEFDVKSLKPGHVSPSPQHLALLFDLLGKQPADAGFRRSLVLSLLLQEVTHACVSPLNLPTLYLPPDRTSIMHAHRALAGSIVASAPYAGAGTVPAQAHPTLSGLVSDFLSQLILLDETSGHGGIDFAKRIEDGILKGAVEVERSAAGYPEFYYRPHDWPKKAGRLPLMHASSMATELAPLVLFLRHRIKGNSILIFEEPAARLHPEMQVELIKHLADMANHGMTVVITTHSSWVIDVLTNIIGRSGISRGKGRSTNEAFDSDKVSLKPENVGAWLFEPEPDRPGCTAREIEPDENGIYPTGYDEVATALHNEWASIEREIEKAS